MDRAPTPGMGLAALFLSIAGLLFFPIVGSIGGLILGYRSRLEGGTATAAIVLGWLGLLVYGTLTVLYFTTGFSPLGDG
jgi:uncharacterized oligopeptide transporter (OPT) family protein